MVCAFLMQKEGDNMAVLENARHEKFVQCLLTGMSQRKAYREAFSQSRKWKDNTVDSRACELANNSEILGRYKELQEQAMDKAIMGCKERMVFLSNIARDEEEYSMSKIKAIDTLNKMDGVYTSKLELSGAVNLSAEDKKKATNEFLNNLIGEEDE